MILKNVPPSILVALGLGCGPSLEDDTSTTCLSSVSFDDDGTDVGPCLSECLGMLPTTDEGTTEESDVGPCLDATGCLTDIDTSTGTSESGGFISASSDTSDSGTSTDSGTDSGTSTGTDSGTSTGTDSGTGGTTGAAPEESPRARSWREALQRMDEGGTLPSDVLVKLRAQKGPR
jgi:hypothetical protein